MALVFSFRNRQKSRAVNMRLLRHVTRELLADLLQIVEADLGFFLVSAPEMTRFNETFLHHAGSTDVITFDYAEKVGQASRLSSGPAQNNLQRDRRDACPTLLHGEIFVCMDEALSQARHFHTTWQSELVRYIVHGVLHLLGHDDQRSAARQRMKQAENTLLRLLASKFPIRSLAAPRFKGRA